MTVRELEGRVDSAEISEWMAFFKHRARGHQRQNLDQSALHLAAQAAQSLKGK